MSGGSYDYVSYKLDEAARTLLLNHGTRPHVVALANQLVAIGNVMHDIEWADSGDSEWTEALDAAIRNVVTPAQELYAARVAGNAAVVALLVALERAA